MAEMCVCARAARGANCPPPLPPTRTGAICTAAKITMPQMVRDREGRLF